MTRSESLAISDILAELHIRYPKLNFPQYEDALAEHGILYAESVTDFGRIFTSILELLKALLVRL